LFISVSSRAVIGHFLPVLRGAVLATVNSMGESSVVWLAERLQPLDVQDDDYGKKHRYTYSVVRPTPAGPVRWQYWPPKDQPGTPIFCPTTGTRTQISEHGGASFSGQQSIRTRQIQIERGQTSKNVTMVTRFIAHSKRAYTYACTCALPFMLYLISARSSISCTPTGGVSRKFSNCYKSVPGVMFGIARPVCELMPNSSLLALPVSLPGTRDPKNRQSPVTQ
jgi:hypothetical protein